MNWKPPQHSSRLQETPLGGSPGVGLGWPRCLWQGQKPAAALPGHGAATDSHTQPEGRAGYENSLPVCLRGGDWKRKFLFAFWL